MVKKGQSGIQSQLHRLEGQLQAIEKLIAGDTPLAQTLQQIEAVRGNLKSLEKRLLKERLDKLNDQQLQRCFDYLCKLN